MQDDPFPNQNQGTPAWKIALRILLGVAIGLVIAVVLLIGICAGMFPRF